MLPSFLFVSVILHPVSVTSRRCDWITEKDGNDRKDGNFWFPFYEPPSLWSLRSKSYKIYFKISQLVVSSCLGCSCCPCCLCCRQSNNNTNNGNNEDNFRVPHLKDFVSDFWEILSEATSSFNRKHGRNYYFRNASVFSVCFRNSKHRFRNVMTVWLNYRKGRKGQKRRKFLYSLFSGFFVFSCFFGITIFVMFHSENYENFEIYENISVMLLSFLFVSVILYTASVMSWRCDWITEKDGNDRKDGNFWFPIYCPLSLSICRKVRCKDKEYLMNKQE